MHVYLSRTIGYCKFLGIYSTAYSKHSNAKLFSYNFAAISVYCNKLHCVIPTKKNVLF